MPEATPKPDEQIAPDATRDIAANVTGGRDWKDYDQKYAVSRILRAIRDASKIRGE